MFGFGNGMMLIIIQTIQRNIQVTNNHIKMEIKPDPRNKCANVSSTIIFKFIVN